MKYFTILCLIGGALATTDYTGYQVWRTNPTRSQLPLLRQLQEKFILDVWSHSYKDGDFEDFMVAPHQLQTIEDHLKYRGIAFDVMINDLQQNYDDMIKEKALIGGDSFDYENYHTYNELEAWIDEMIATYSSSSLLLTKELVGTSYEGRDFYALKMSTNVNGNEDREAMVLDCGLHSREWVSPASCTNIAKFFIEDFNMGSSIQYDTLQALDIHMIPVANPDGYVYSWTTDRNWRKTRTPFAQNGCKSACDGVDPNRNFDSNFAGSDDFCCSDSFHGPSAFSEPCTAAQRDYLSDVNNVTPVRVYIDFHAYSQMWMYPYGYTTSLPSHAAVLDEIANGCVAAIQNTHGKAYTPGQISIIIYKASGGSADWAYDTLGIYCSFAVELRDKGFYGFTLPANQIVPTAEEAYAALLVVAESYLGGKCY